MLYDVSIDSQHIIGFVKETQKLRLFLLVGFGADAYCFV
jgi:hypothetical protein